jgi:hypothetical protein
MTGETSFSAKTANNKSEHKNVFFVNNFASSLGFIKRIFREHTQKSDDAKRHRFLEKTCWKRMLLLFADIKCHSVFAAKKCTVYDNKKSL